MQSASTPRNIRKIQKPIRSVKRAKVLPCDEAHYPRRAPPPKKNPCPKFEYRHEEARHRVDLKRDLRARGIPFNKEAKTEILVKTHERVGETYTRTSSYFDLTVLCG